VRKRLKLAEKRLRRIAYKLRKAKRQGQYTGVKSDRIEHREV
jgi:hypothetical protein